MWLTAEAWLGPPGAWVTLLISGRLELSTYTEPNKLGLLIWLLGDISHFINPNFHAASTSSGQKKQHSITWASLKLDWSWLCCYLSSRLFFLPDGNICCSVVGIFGTEETMRGKNTAWPTAVNSGVFFFLSWGMKQTERMQTWMGSLFWPFFSSYFPLSLLGIPGNCMHLDEKLDWENVTD